MIEWFCVTNTNVYTLHIKNSWRWDLPICLVEGSSAGSSPGSCAPLFPVMCLCFDEPRTGRHAHLQGQGLHATMHTRQLGVEQRWATHTQAFTGVGARRIDVEHWCWAGGETGRGVGTSQVLQLGIRRDFGREVMDGHTGVETVGIDFV